MNKKILMMLFLVLSIAITMYADTGVNRQVQENFKSRFGNVTVINWERVADVNVGFFNHEGEEINVYYNDEGDLLATGKYIAISRVKATTVAAIKKKYEGWVLQQAYEYTEDGSAINYLVTIKNTKYTAIVEVNQYGGMSMVRRKKNRDVDMGEIKLVHVSRGEGKSNKGGVVSQVVENRLVKSIELSNGISLQYVEQGDSKGIPVVFLHGYTDSWRSFEPVLPYLPENIHAFTVSQRGHGYSSRPLTGYAPQDLASDIAAFIKKQQLGPVVLVGHSMGATVAQRLALDHPELVKGLVLVGSFASFRNNQVVAELHQMVLAMTDSVGRDFAREFQRSTVVKPISTEMLEVFVDESLKLSPRIWKAVLNDLVSVDYRDQLHAIDKPTLIMWGDKDHIAVWQDQHTIHKSISKSKLRVYEGSGHAIHWEEPSMFAKDLVDFVRSAR